MNTSKVIIGLVLVGTVGLAFVLLQNQKTIVPPPHAIVPIPSIPEVPDPRALTEVYASSTGGFLIRYPKGYTADEAYIYQALGPGKEIRGVRFIIPQSMASGTNLSPDSYISIESKSNVSRDVCTAGLFLDLRSEDEVTTLRESNMTYSFASTSDAAAGNRYEEMVYAFPTITNCMAVRYLVHYGAIENYDLGTIQEFDRTTLVTDFHAIRKTLKLHQ